MPYTEPIENKALQRLADDIEQAMPAPAWADDPAIRDNDGEPVDLGQPLTRRERFWLAVLIASVVVVFTVGSVWLAAWIGGIR